ncbi:uncharacterized protein TM35_000133080 [Trypanosoma theileri]|uniref:Uncharacterized protein n=1 Tax=Trypanosoma theileri TaxID=67003 RepID=A0A1X0NX74_9TRYP|nr:uncharacterized protein TM35_000133080 [Trypanosoma theileri]ORC89304.1 hypothetical protein TM35_000133080 [Trypanosoma theileri]
MQDESGYIGFAFITPTSMLPCGVKKQHQLLSRSVESLSSSSSSSSRVAVESIPLIREHGRKVCIRFFDTIRKATRTQFFSVLSGSTMSCIYEIIHAWLPEVGGLVCYTVQSDDHGRLFPLVKEVLHPGVEVPELLFCQEVFLPLQKVTDLWGVVNILVMQHHNDLVPGYIPLIIQRTSMSSKEAIQEQIRYLCCASPAEAEYMKLQSFLSCSIYEGVIELISFFDSFDNDLESLPQIAIVYPALATGDLVRVDIVDRVGRRYSVQGVIKHSRRKDGVICYDVEDVTLGHVLEGLTCVQALPL